MTYAVEVRNRLEEIQDMHISERTNRRCLNASGSNGKKNMRMSQNGVKRLAFACKHVHWNLRKWSKVIFTYVFRFCSLAPYGRYKGGERYFEYKIVPRLSSNGGSIMRWGGTLKKLSKIMWYLLYHSLC